MTNDVEIGMHRSTPISAYDVKHLRRCQLVIQTAGAEFSGKFIRDGKYRHGAICEQ